MCVAAQNLKAAAYFMNAVVDGFQLGGFVNDIFRCCDFAAIMQPGGNMQRVPVVAAHFKVTQRAAVFLNGGGSQQAGNNGHALAVGSGIRRFGVNGPARTSMKDSSSCP